MNYAEAMAVLKISDPKEAKAAYRKLLFKHHVDHGGNGQMFQRLNDAYRVLGNAPRPQIVELMQKPSTKFKESAYQSKVIAKLKSLNAFVFNCAGGQLQVAGMPDLWFAHPQLSMWLELKVKAPLAPLQAHKLRLIAERNVPALVLRWRDAAHVCEWTDGTLLSDPFGYDNFLQGLQQGVEELRTLLQYKGLV